MNTKEIKPFNTYYDFIEERNMWLCSIGKGGFLIVCREVGETKRLAFQSALKSFLILKKENPSIIENMLNDYNKLKRKYKGLNKEINPDLINKKPMKTLLTTILLFICIQVIGQKDSIETYQQENEYGSIDIYNKRNMDERISFWYDSEGIVLQLPVKFNTLTLSDFVNYWKEYKQECYNDSTCMDRSTYLCYNNKTIIRQDSCGLDQSYVMYCDILESKREIIYIHKDPNNFLEFMEYLETKIK